MMNRSVIATATARQRRTAPIIGAGLNLAADWVARSTAAGVVQAIRFNSAANVTNYRHLDGLEGNISQDLTDGILGDGCLKFNIPSTDGANSGAWRCPSNAAWVTDGQGFGTADVYVQYRLKLGPNRLLPAGDAVKFSIFGGYKPSSPNSSSSHTSNELVLINGSNSGALWAYRDTASGATQLDRVDGNGIHLQTAIDRGAGFANIYDRYCLYESGPTASAGCWRLQEQVWFTIYVHYKLVNEGGAGVGNIFNLYVARNTENSYTQLDDIVNFAILADPVDAPLGPNGIWLLPYDTNRVSATYSTYHKYDQLIVSTQPIACPLS